jgi:hypothetical protein
MTQRVDFDGQVHEFPDDFTPQDIQKALASTDQKRVADVVTSPDFLSGLAGDMSKGNYQPAVDPGFFERLNQRGAQTLNGTQAPPLQASAGFGSKAADTVANIEDLINGISAAGSRGYTFGTSDEADALAATLKSYLKTPQLQDVVLRAATGQQEPSFGDRFLAADKEANKRIADFKDAHPIIGNAAEITGMVTSPIGNAGTGFIQRGANIATRALRAGTVGATLGGAAGVAQSDGTIPERLESGAVGAGTGAILGGTITPAIEALTGAGRVAYDTIRNQIRAHQDPTGQAQRLVANALLRDNQTVPQAVATLQANPAAAVLDASGPNMVALGRQATVAPGPARQVARDFLEGRQADQAARFQQGLAPVGNGANYQQQIQNLMDQRSVASRPFYQALEGIDPERLDTPFFQNLLHSGPGQQLLGRAREIAALEHARGATPVNLMEPLLDQEGNLRTATVPNFRAMDYVKQAADDITASHMNQTTGRIEGPVGYNWDQLRRAIVSNLDQAAENTGPNGENLYQAARGAYAGPSRTMEAMHEGRAFFGDNQAEDAIHSFRQLSPAEQDAFRIGVASDLAGKLGNKADNANAYNLLMNSPNKRAKLQAVFPDQESFDRFLAQSQQENRMFQNAQTVTGGSPTARIEADKDDAMQQIGDRVNLIRQLIMGPRIQALATAVTRGTNVRRGLSEPVATELGNILFNGNTPQNIQRLQALNGNGVNPGLLQVLTQGQNRARAIGRGGTALLSNALAQGSGTASSALVNALSSQ